MTLGLGEVCALLAPLSWAVAVILFRRSDQAGLSPAAMNLFKNTLAIALLSLTLLAMGHGPPPGRSLGDWGILAVSGLLGLAIADTLLFAGLRRIGAARLALVDTVYAPMMVLLSWVFLAERPSVGFLLGAVGVLGGVSLASLDLRRAVASGDRGVALGALMAFGAITGTGISVILVKPLLAEADLVEVIWVRLIAGVLGQLVWVTARREWGEVARAFRPGPAWRTLVPAAFIGTYVSLLLWLGGFKWADASVAAVLNQLATIYTLTLAWAVLGEQVVPRQVAGALLAVAGAVVIVLT
ncbi:MAG: DMT family transporter [Myxococcota bacterium]